MEGKYREINVPTPKTDFDAKIAAFMKELSTMTEELVAKHGLDMIAYTAPESYPALADRAMYRTISTNIGLRSRLGLTDAKSDYATVMDVLARCWSEPGPADYMKADLKYKEAQAQGRKQS